MSRPLNTAASLYLKYIILHPFCQAWQSGVFVSALNFVKAAGIRAVKTMAQTAVSLIGVGAVMSDINWLQVASASLLAGILSVLTSIATGLPEVDGDHK